MEGDLHDNFIYPVHRGYFQTVLLIINDPRTDLSRIIKMEWPMLNIPMGTTIYLSIIDALVYLINEQKVDGVEYPGCQLLIDQIGQK